MKVAYYPGCSLKGTARDYAKSISGCFDSLGIELVELEDWNCCGATAAHSINEKAAIGLAARNLSLASKTGLELVVPCPLCYNRLKTAQTRLAEGSSRDRKAECELKVWDLANFMASGRIRERIRSCLKRPLAGLKVVCYYGCMASRPPRITGEKSYENPTSMDCILQDIGVDVRDWSYKTDCCGASHLVARPDIVFSLALNLYKHAKRAGAQLIAVSCQMCQANLDLHQHEILGTTEPDETLPVVYFTELIAMAVGHRDVEKWLKSHFVNPIPRIQGGLEGLEIQGTQASKSLFKGRSS